MTSCVFPKSRVQSTPERHMCSGYIVVYAKKQSHAGFQGMAVLPLCDQMYL